MAVAKGAKIRRAVLVAFVGIVTAIVLWSLELLRNGLFLVPSARIYDPLVPTGVGMFVLVPLILIMASSKFRESVGIFIPIGVVAFAGVSLWLQSALVPSPYFSVATLWQLPIVLVMSILGAMTRTAVSGQSVVRVAGWTFLLFVSSLTFNVLNRASSIENVLTILFFVLLGLLIYLKLRRRSDHRV